MILRIETHYFVAGAIFEKKEGKWVCIEAAPIIKWMIGKPMFMIEKFCKKHKYQWIK